MTPEQFLQFGSAVSELPLHAILLIIVIVLWLDLRRTRQALNDCLAGNRANSQRIDDHENAIAQLIEDVMK